MTTKSMNYGSGSQPFIKHGRIPNFDPRCRARANTKGPLVFVFRNKYEYFSYLFLLGLTNANEYKQR